MSRRRFGQFRSSDKRNEKRALMVVSRSFPPSIEAGGCTVLRQLFQAISPEEYVVVRGNLPPFDPTTALPVPTAVVDIRPSRFIYSRFAFLFAPVVTIVALLFALKWRPRHVFAVYPFDFFAIGAFTAARLLRLPFSIYLLDVWADAGRNTIENWAAQRFEPIVVCQAKHVFVISDALKDHYGCKYGVECIVVRHPISFNLFKPQVRYQAGIKPCYHIVYTGNVSNLNRKIVKNMVQAVRMINEPSVQLDIYSGQNPDEIRDALALSEQDKVTVQTVSSADIPNIQQGADILFVGLSFDLDLHTSATVFPTKLAEYLSAGEPILVNAPGDSFLGRFVKESNCALLVEKPDVTQLHQAVIKLLTDSRLALEYARKAVEVAQSFEATRQAKTVADALGFALAKDLDALSYPA